MPGLPPSLRILVVENNADTRALLAMYLLSIGHEVVTAASVQEAVAVLAPGAFEVLISDIGLPDGNGWDLLSSLGHRDELYSIAMSGFGLPGDQAKSSAAGYRHHLVKPFDPDELTAMLDKAAKARQAA